MRLDGARSATRKAPKGGTCATRVTRGTFDFQARDNFELRDKEFARKFQARSTQSSFQAKVSRTYSRSAQSRLQAKVSPTRHTRRTRPTPQQNSSAKPCASPPGGATRTLPLPMRNKRTLFSDALLPALYLKRAQPEIYGIMQDCFRWIVPFYRVRPINHRNFIGAIC